MSDRDKLAKLLFITDNSRARNPERAWEILDPAYLAYVYAMADALIEAGYVMAQELLDAGYRKPWQVTTVEDLDALPEGAVVLDAAECPCEGCRECVATFSTNEGDA